MTETTTTAITAPAHIRARFAAKLDAAKAIKVDATETVTVNDLNENDVVTRIGNVTFNPPITLSQVRKMPKRRVAVLRSHDGWFSMTPIALTDTAERAC